MSFGDAYVANDRASLFVSGASASHAPAGAGIGLRLRAQPGSETDSAAPFPDLVSETEWLKYGELLGRGAFGVVHKALNVRSGEFVAIKRLALGGGEAGDVGGGDRRVGGADDGGGRGKQLRDMKREVELLRGLVHDNIVKFIFCIEEPRTSVLCLGMEYCSGGSLAQVVRRFGPLPERLLAIYISQVLGGLCYLHGQGVIHRDIKGANLLLTKDGVVKLADFGIATRLAASGPGATRLSVVGTPFWMAPEVIEMQRPAPAADIWSVGCTIVELLTGAPPWSEFGPIPAMFKMVGEPHPPLPPGVSHELESFLLACFVRAVASRPSASALAAHGWLTAPTATMPLIAEMHASLSHIAGLSESERLAIDDARVDVADGIVSVQTGSAAARATEPRAAAELSSGAPQVRELGAQLGSHRRAYATPRTADMLADVCAFLDGDGRRGAYGSDESELSVDWMTADLDAARATASGGGGFETYAVPLSLRRAGALSPDALAARVRVVVAPPVAGASAGARGGAEPPAGSAAAAAELASRSTTLTIFECLREIADLRARNDALATYAAQLEVVNGQQAAALAREQAERAQVLAEVRASASSSHSSTDAASLDRLAAIEVRARALDGENAQLRASVAELSAERDALKRTLGHLSTERQSILDEVSSFRSVLSSSPLIRERINRRLSVDAQAAGSPPPSGEPAGGAVRAHALRPLRVAVPSSTDESPMPRSPYSPQLRETALATRLGDAPDFLSRAPAAPVAPVPIKLVRAAAVLNPSVPAPNPELNERLHVVRTEALQGLAAAVYASPPPKPVNAFAPTSGAAVANHQADFLAKLRFFREFQLPSTGGAVRLG